MLCLLKHDLHVRICCFGSCLWGEIPKIDAISYVKCATYVNKFIGLVFHLFHELSALVSFVGDMCADTSFNVDGIIVYINCITMTFSSSRRLNHVKLGPKRHRRPTARISRFGKLNEGKRPWMR